jgi:hypothetical protein
MKRVVFFLDEREYEALCSLAGQELRDYRSQALLIVKRELERLGFLAGEQVGKEETGAQDGKQS